MILHELGRTLLILCAVMVFVVLYAQHMTGRWRKAAERLGLSFRPHDPDGAMKVWMLQLGYAVSARGEFSYILEGTFEGRPALVAQYTWGQGKSRASMTVACFTLRRQVPPFALAPEGLGDKLLSAFGAQDLDFPEDPEFSSRFVLKGEEPRVRPFFDPMLRHRLLAAEGWSLAGQGSELVVFKRARTVSPDKLEDFIRETRRVAEAFS